MNQALTSLEQHKFGGMSLWNFGILHVLILWAFPIFLIVLSGLGSISGHSGGFSDVISNSFFEDVYLERFLFYMVGDIALGIVLFPLLCLVTSMLICYKRFWSLFSNKAWFILSYVASIIILFFPPLVFALSATMYLLTGIMFFIPDTGLGSVVIAIIVQTMHLISYPILLGILLYSLVSPTRRPIATEESSAQQIQAQIVEKAQENAT